MINMNIKKALILALLFLIFGFVIFSGLVIIGDSCRYFVPAKIDYALMYGFLLLPIMGFLIEKIFSIKKELKGLFSGVLPLLFSLITLPVSFKSKHNFIEESNCLIRKGVVVDKFVGKVNQSIKVNYMDDQYRYKKTYSNFRLKIKDIEIGDSILIMHVDGCTELSRVYNAKPTPEEWAKCKEYGYLIDGKLYSREEYEPSLK